MLWDTCGCHRTICGSQSSPTMLVPGTDLAAGTFTLWVISPPLLEDQPKGALSFTYQKSFEQVCVLIFSLLTPSGGLQNHPPIFKNLTFAIPCLVLGWYVYLNSWDPPPRPKEEGCWWGKQMQIVWVVSFEQSWTQYSKRCFCVCKCVCYNMGIEVNLKEFSPSTK